MSLSLESVVVVSGEQVHRRLDAETIILDIRGGSYYGLDEVGTRVWGLVQQPVEVKALASAITGEYDVDRRTCERDLLILLQDLLEAGLIELSDEASS